ncbi:hypothetical protein HMPREF0653_02345 [Prevotella disiens JCM 6334 = ATCC 29426]|uniref:Uncharacterized protein n=1 Tax=Prevotella disiens JCM 6334 = ATCC 29426 TaxID=1235811 RepID=A0ABN0NPF8_9BACT|nr:hypothetical protein HMPREF0653_02345 [Prevotella disiens JCM 6334 = ATCC 29426]
MCGDRLIVNQNYDKWKRYIHVKILRNKLIRQYIPKKDSFEHYTEKRIMSIPQ